MRQRVGQERGTNVFGRRRTPAGAGWTQASRAISGPGLDGSDALPIRRMSISTMATWY